MKTPKRFLPALCAAASAWIASFPLAHHGRAAETTLMLEAEDFQLTANWIVESDSGCSGGKMLKAAGSDTDALTLIDLPVADKYHLWTRSRDYATKNPGSRRYLLVIDNQPVDKESGAHGAEGWKWEEVGTRDLGSGGHVIGLRDTRKYFGRCDAILFTTDGLDPNTQPIKALARYRIKPKQISLDGLEQSFPAMPKLQKAPPARVAQIRNGLVRITFSEGRDSTGRPLIVRDTEIRSDGSWAKIPTLNQESLFLLYSARNNVNTSNYFPFWRNQIRSRLEIGGKSYDIAPPGCDPFLAGDIALLIPRTAKVIDGSTVDVGCDSASGQTATVRWQLRPRSYEVKVNVTFEAARDGFYSVGFCAFKPWSDPKIAFNLLSPLYQFQRRPAQPVMVTSSVTPQPYALVQTAIDGKPYCFSVVADPRCLPFRWPLPANAPYGFSLLNATGGIQPSIFSPVLGLDGSNLAKGAKKTVSWFLLATPGDWKKSFSYVSDHIFGVTDYRKPYKTSLTDAALNIIDLLKDGINCGWDARLKGFYNIESPNTASQASPLAVIEAAVLTRDEELYKDRALPTIAYTLSRPGAHFAVDPPAIVPSYVTSEQTRITVPSRFFGTSYWQGVDQLLARKNPWIADMALDHGEPRHSAAYSACPLWSDLLGAYRLKPDPVLLDRIQRECDHFLTTNVYGRHAGELGTIPFYNISFYPYWWDLPDLYELTGDKKYLDAAQECAFLTMAGQWSHPKIPAGNITIHPGNQFRGVGHEWWKGEVKFELGYPLAPGAIREKQVPVWLVAQQGLGFEQPVTYYGGGNAEMGNILMSAWTPSLLRMYQLTGNDIYRTYARNAIIARFGNYPGYYLRGFTDIEIDPQFPLKGPDVTSIYYHHIPAHLAFTLDYLVTDAEARSGGKIEFPWARQEGYAWFDSRVYGGAPGRVYDDKEMRLWLDRTAFQVKSPEVNYLAARSDKRFDLILMNDSAEKITARIFLDTQKIGIATDEPWRVIAKGVPHEEGGPFRGAPSISPHGLIVLSFPVKGKQSPVIPVLNTAPIEQSLPGEWGAMHAFRIRSPFADDSLYVVLTGRPKVGSSARLRIEGDDTMREATNYPYEFIVHPWQMERDMTFTLALKNADGTESQSSAVTLKGTR